MYKDFDAFSKEVKDENITFKVQGEIYEVPTSPPAFLMLELMAEQTQEKDENVNPSTIKKFLKVLLGDEQYTRLSNSGVSLRVFTEIVQWLVSIYGDDTDEKKTMTTTTQD